MSKKDIRTSFRNSVYKRDKFICQVCGKKGTEDTLNAHHITDRHLMPNGGYVKENGITVCELDCHMKVETFHITNGKEWVDGLHPDDLYKKIRSSYEMAYKASEENTFVYKKE